MEDHFETGPDFAAQLDEQDPLAPLRDEFYIADPDLIYLDGNSLGRLPHAARRRVIELVEKEWGEALIRGWGESWYEAPRRIGDKIGRLLGAAPGQTLVGESTTTSLYKLAVSALRMRPGRAKVVSDALNFPTDLYMLEDAVRTLGAGHRIELLDSPDGIEMDTGAILEAIDDDTALVTFSHPTFKSGYLYEVEAITRRAHQAGALVLWDFSHGAGSVPIALDDWGIDFAAGCTYKYLNGGPGAPAFLYVRRDLQDQVDSPLWGWWGHRQPFAFDLDFEPAEDISRLLVGTPPVLSMMTMEPGVDLLLRAGVEALRAKSIRQTSYLVFLLDAILGPLGFRLGSPRDPDRRGSHVSLRHPEGYRISRALIEEMQVIPDFREPDNLRLGLAPLYTRYRDVWEAVERIRTVVVEERFRAYSTERSAVT